MRSMVLLIDANIVLDVLMNRSEFYEDSSKIWKLCETEQITGYVSTLSFANIMYIMRKELTPDEIKSIFNQLRLIFRFAAFTPQILEKAVAMNWKDFEDAVQSATAESIHADFICTRNIRDFSGSSVVAFTPHELLDRI